MRLSQYATMAIAVLIVTVGSAAGLPLRIREAPAEEKSPTSVALVPYGHRWASDGPYTNNTDLVSMVYSRRGTFPERQEENMKFFIRHGLQSNVDYVFIINDDAPYDILSGIPRLPNIFIVHKDNSCFDLGSHPIGVDFAEQKTGKKYLRLVFLNSSVRGPFTPLYFDGCWTDLFFNLLNDKVKLVGTTHACDGRTQLFMQSMVLAYDRVGFDLSRNGTFTCQSTFHDAVAIGEVGNLRRMKEHGFVGVFLSAHSESKREICAEGEKSGFDYENHSPTEILFWKVNRDMGNIGQPRLNDYTNWYDSLGSRCRHHIGVGTPSPPATPPSPPPPPPTS